MPELPEVETVKRSLEPAWIEKRFTKIDIRKRDLRIPIPAEFINVLTNQKVSKIIRRGKYIIVLCGAKAGFVLHLGMSGSIRIFAPGEKFEPRKHDHAIFETADGIKVAYNDPRRFGMLYLIDPKNWEKEKPFSEMGPEPLEPDFDADTLMEAFKARKAPIKAALLDQYVVAGLGNIYVCEALYRSHISPLRPANTLTYKEAEKLVGHIRGVLEDAIRSGGSSLRDHKLTDGKLGYFQHHFDVYDREGEICKSCRRKKVKIACVKRITQSGRSTFYCSNTQA